MIVVADASPLNYLIQVHCEIVLRELYGRVFVPYSVLQELRHPAAPLVVSEWAAATPSWIEVRSAQGQSDPALEVLDPGEREAIQLAVEIAADTLLIDEHRGRMEAKRRGITTTGTLGVLLAADNRDLLDAEATFRKLVDETSFRASPELQAEFLRRIRKR